MKRNLLFIFFLCLVAFANGEKLELNGIFFGKNIYVMNPFSDSGVGFCVHKVTVNGQISADEINSSAFEIDLIKFNFDFGENVSIVLHYEDGCIPKIINPEAIRPQSTFVLQSAEVDKKGVLHWVTRQESGVLPYVVQQFRWNKWIVAGEVKGKGAPTLNKYELNVHLHTGENRFRIYQTDYTGVPRYSSDITCQSSAEVIRFDPEKVKDELLFTDSTLYEMYDSYGIVVVKDFGKRINLKGLQSGLYYINYDNTMGSFKKK